MSKHRNVALTIVGTTDVHGHYFPYDFINNRPSKGSLARVYAYVQELRKGYGDKLILLDNGDILQGQPTAYYYNFIDTKAPHLAASIINAMHYDAVGIGNHDVETGHAVYDRWAAQCKCPVLAANALDARTREPYFKPYTLIEREGVRVAILGLTTPAVPYWLPKELWTGLYFEDMLVAAQKWVKIIKEKEHPHVLIGLFHSGKDGGIVTDTYRENAAFDVARQVPGFDAIIFGHDHSRMNETVTNCDGQPVPCLNPSSLGWLVARIDIKLSFEDDKLTEKRITGTLPTVNRYSRKSTAVEKFEKYFRSQFLSVESFVNRRIGHLAHTLRGNDAYFGSSAFIDLIHTLQLKISGADISFAAPLSYDATIAEGDIHVRDMFKLYKFENMLYTMRLTGKEIKAYMEMSYGIWTNQMLLPDDHLLLLSPIMNGGTRLGLTNYAYNFDSAAGLRYTVDVRKPVGEKITIVSMADGSPFRPEHTYLVTTNSYRGNGGGELLTKGAGIPQTELHTRMVKSTQLDLRYYLMKAIEEMGKIDPQPLNQWHFVPRDWVEEAIKRDRKLLFRE